MDAYVNFTFEAKIGSYSCQCDAILASPCLGNKFLLPHLFGE